MNRFFSLFFLQFRLLNWYILTLCVCCACLRIYVKDHNKGKHRSLSETQSNTISQAIIPPPLPPSTHPRPSCLPLITLSLPAPSRLSPSLPTFPLFSHPLSLLPTSKNHGRKRKRKESNPRFGVHSGKRRKG